MIVFFPYYSATNKHGETAPRTGFFHEFGQGELLAKRYDPKNETLMAVEDEDGQRMKADLKNLDRFLGPYPYDSWKKWVSLTNRISAATLTR